MIETFVEVTLKEDGDFLKVKETLTRIGIPHYGTDNTKPTLWQSCHILHKQGKFYIVHFKELFALDEESRRLRGIPQRGRKTDFTDEDKARRNTIAEMLDTWGLVELVNPGVVDSPKAPKEQIKVLPHKDKNSWNLEPKYAIGRKKYGGRDNN